MVCRIPNSNGNQDTYDEKYSKWNIADLLIIPSEYKYEVAKATKKQFTILKKLMDDKETDTVINVCDTGQQYFSSTTSMVLLCLSLIHI